MPSAVPASPLIPVQDMQAAQLRLRPYIVRTPLVPFPLEGFWLKPESLQPTGAFKLRGAFNALLSLSPEARVRGVVAHSSGNHAQAVAYAAQQLGIPAVIVMPSNAPRIKLKMTQAFGAEVIVVGPASEERAHRAKELTHSRGLTPIAPYDDPRIIAGAGTIGLEILEDLPDIGTVLVPVSGGGLISGVAAALKQLHPQVRVIGVEPELAADARDSLRGGQLVTYSAEQVGQTLADGLRRSASGNTQLGTRAGLRGRHHHRHRERAAPRRAGHHTQGTSGHGAERGRHRSGGVVSPGGTRRNWPIGGHPQRRQPRHQSAP